MGLSSVISLFVLVHEHAHRDAQHRPPSLMCKRKWEHTTPPLSPTFRVRSFISFPHLLPSLTRVRLQTRTDSDASIPPPLSLTPFAVRMRTNTNMNVSVRVLSCPLVHFLTVATPYCPSPFATRNCIHEQTQMRMTDIYVCTVFVRVRICPPLARWRPSPSFTPLALRRSPLPTTTVTTTLHTIADPYLSVEK